MDPWNFDFASMWNNNVANNLGTGWNPDAVPPIVKAFQDPVGTYNPALGIGAIRNPGAVAEMAAQAGVPPTVLTQRTQNVQLDDTPTLGDSLEPKKEGDTKEEISSQKKEPGIADRLMKAFKGVQPIAAPEPPKVGTPAAPRPVAAIQPGLAQLMQLIGLQQQGAPLRIPSLPQTFGGR